MTASGPSEDDDLYAEPSTGEDSFLAAMLDAPDAEPPLRPGQSVAEHFTIVRELGVGGMGRVYLAFDNALDRAVAIKVHRDAVDAEAIARMRGEAKAIARLSHPNVVGVFEVGDVDGRMFIVMEYIDGLRLDRWQREKGRGWRAILGAYTQAGEALLAAHRAGLVHRDFKPQNVMVEDDAGDLRVRVLDFGLARAVASPTGGASDLRDGLQTDGRVGTPAYVAPEQRFDGTVSEAADQYSFAVSLWEALCGQRPPGGLLDGFTAPRWLLDAVRRGFSEEPQARWPSMQAMLEALAADPMVRRRRVGLALGAVALVGVGGLGASAVAQDARCPAPEAALGIAWDDERREAVADAFGAVEEAYADAALGEVQSGLDDYAVEWMAASDASCSATDGVPAGLRPRSALCIEHRRQELDALTQVLSAADATVVGQAVEAVALLPSLTGCTDLERLSAQVDEPPPSAAAAVEEARARIAAISAERQLGRPSRVLEDIGAVMALAQSTGYVPLIAEGHQEYARVLDGLGRSEDAEAEFRNAYAAAVASGHDEVALRSAQLLIGLVGHELARPAEGHEWAFHAEALHGRPAAAGREPQTWSAKGTLLKDQARFDQAIALLEKAADAMKGADALPAAYVLNDFAAVLSEAGQHRRAIEVQRQVLELYASALPEDHPERAITLANLAGDHDALGEYDQALEAIARARSIREAALPASHPSHADTERNYATILLGMGRYAEAEQAFTRAIERMVVARGPNHPRVGNAWAGKCTVYAKWRRLDQAVDACRTAVEILDGADGGQAVLGGALMSYGLVLLEFGNIEEGIAVLERTASVIEAQEGKTSDFLASVLMNLGVAESMRGRPEKALERYETVRALHEDAGRPVSASLWSAMGTAHSLAGDDAKALQFMERGLESKEASLGPDHPELIFMLFNIGFTLEGLERFDDAKAAYARALQIAETAFGPDSQKLAIPLEGLGGLELDAGHFAEAAAYFERALKVAEGREAPARVGEIRFLYAQALWGQGERAQAVDAAKTARETYAALENTAEKLASIDAWLAEPKRRRWTK